MINASTDNSPFAINKPTLVVDKNRAIHNIRKMQEKVKRNNIEFRPHFKTHQSADIGTWFSENGVTAITVSSVDMASYFAENGWNDITIAFSVNILQIDEINRLAGNINLHLLVESVETVEFLSGNLINPVNTWIKIDAGYHRTGISCDRFDDILTVVNSIEKSDRLSFQGILTHSGHSYYQSSKESVERIYFKTIEKLNMVKDYLETHGVTKVKISVGDTPSCSVVEDFGNVDEIRPGNFLFYDIMQTVIGSCTEDEIAVAVACPVVAKHKERSEIVLYGGAVHLSKEYIKESDGLIHYGRIAFWNGKGWGTTIKNSYIKSVSQEHGILKTDSATFDSISVGSLVFILPVHSCLTVDLLRNFVTTDGLTLNAATY
ncbi:alanine racemase [candidate division KSB1 bacterium]|nr:alanine racemase [candidate division KSB1 bacterium]